MLIEKGEQAPIDTARPLEPLKYLRVAVIYQCPRLHDVSKADNLLDNTF